MRSALLWGSRNATLRNTLPKFKFVRRAVTRFMPGETIEDALNAAEELRRHTMPTIITHLGENLTHQHEAEAVAQHYLDVLDRIKQRGLDCYVSVKPTQLGLDFSERLCHELSLNIAEQARATGTMMWIDMENSPYVDRTITLFKRLRQQLENVGLCLQSYLVRTEKDLDDLLPLNPSIRLVKGAYAEPAGVVFPTKRDTDEQFYKLSLKLIKAAAKRKAEVGVGTHDLPLIQRIRSAIRQEGIPDSTYEVQMLYGIKREEQLRLRKEGLRVRVLISYGTYWFPWYMRRLAERPANVWFVVKNMFGG